MTTFRLVSCASYTIFKIQLETFHDLKYHEVTGRFSQDSCRNSVYKSGVDVKFDWMRHHFLDEKPFYAYWGGDHMLGAECADRNCTQMS